MARTTRTSAAADSDKADGASSTKTSSSRHQLPPPSASPPKLFVLPTKASKEATVITLPHPRHGKPSRYLVCPETGFYEFTRIPSPKNAPRSWLIESGSDAGKTDGQVVSSADLFVATPMDPLFLVLPALTESVIGKKAAGEDQKRLFLSSEDYFDNLPSEASHLQEIVRQDKTRALLESRMAAVCDRVEAGDESMYRLSRDKILATCLDKAKRLAEGDALPPSLEKQFITRALQAPVLNQKSAAKQNGAQTDDSDEQPKTETNGDATETDADATKAENGDVEQAIKPTDEIVRLQKLKVALDLICQRLVSPELTAWLKEGLHDPKAGGVDFAPLEEYLAKLAELRAEAVAARSIGDYSRKHMRDEEEEEAREAKKKKLEEEKKRKASESRGVRDLKKVNVSGMKKLSHFFQKKQ